MNSQTIVMCVVALILGMLLAHMLKDVCGCDKVVEGADQTSASCVNTLVDYCGKTTNNASCSACTGIVAAAKLHHAGCTSNQLQNWCNASLEDRVVCAGECNGEPISYQCLGIRPSYNWSAPEHGPCGRSSNLDDCLGSGDAIAKCKLRINYNDGHKDLTTFSQLKSNYNSGLQLSRWRKAFAWGDPTANNEFDSWS